MGYELVKSNLHCGDFHKLYMDYTIAVEGLILSYHLLCLKVIHNGALICIKVIHNGALICIKVIHNGAAIVKQGIYCNHIYKWTIDICAGLSKLVAQTPETTRNR